MYRCQYKNCQELVPTNRPQLKVVTETREKSYENIVKKSNKGRKKGTVLESVGTEIVKETPVCPACYTLITGEQPAQYIPEVAVQPEKPKKQYSNRPKRKWVNPKQRKKRNLSSKTAKKEEKPRRAPIVEVVNPLPVVKG